MHIQTAVEAILQEPLSGYSSGSGRITTLSGKVFFLKTGAPGTPYVCEANGLRELARTGVIRTPEVIAVNNYFLLTEFIRSSAVGTDFFAELGKQLAAMHRCTGSRFGFYQDNFIGMNPQPNNCTAEEAADWSAFYFNKRLLFQYRLAEKNGYVTSRLRFGFSLLEKRLETILEGSEEPPALLHGDLWSGNFLCGPQQQPVLIDPAVYYGHREADLAMTRLFGGFAPEFYQAYREAYPLKEGWEYRENIYKLYHVLNHLNLFGRGYLAEAESLVEYYR